MDVDWSERGLHMWRRHAISEQMTDEAIADAVAVWLDPDPRSKSGRGIRVIGYSVTCEQVLTVILLPQGSDGSYWGVNGWPSNGRDLWAYRGIRR